jgi:hypothetical protein
VSRRQGDCTIDTDCTDTFVLGCCRTLADGNSYCHRREHGT